MKKGAATPAPSSLDSRHLPQSTTRKQQLARQPARFIRREERRNRPNVIRLPNPAQRSLRLAQLLEMADDNDRRVQPFRLLHSRVDPVHANFLRPQFLSPHTLHLLPTHL